MAQSPDVRLVTEARLPVLAEELGVSENRLYAELIHDGLLIREQMLYMTKLRSLAAATARADAIAVLGRAADEPRLPTDRY